MSVETRQHCCGLFLQIWNARVSACACIQMHTCMLTHTKTHTHTHTHIHHRNTHISTHTCVCMHTHTHTHTHINTHTHPPLHTHTQSSCNTMTKSDLLQCCLRLARLGWHAQCHEWCPCWGRSCRRQQGPCVAASWCGVGRGWATLAETALERKQATWSCEGSHHAVLTAANVKRSQTAGWQNNVHLLH